MNLKLIPLAALLSLTLSGPAKAAERPLTDPTSEYGRAVKSYVDAATEQMRAVRGGIDAQLKDASTELKARFKKVYEELDRSDKLLAQLKTAGPSDFDRIKLEFEQMRAQAFKDIDAAQKS